MKAPKVLYLFGKKPIDNKTVYLQSEADRYIAHIQRKRCEAMAKWCSIGAQFQHDIVMRFDNPIYIKRSEWLEKWRKRWLSLAEHYRRMENG